MKEWADAKHIIGSDRLTLGPQASDQWLNAPDHLAFVLARYRAAAALIGDAQRVLEIGCGEGIGAGILARGRSRYDGIDLDHEAVDIAHQNKSDDRVNFHKDTYFARGFWRPRLFYDAVVSLDVIEHIPADQEDNLMEHVRISHLGGEGGVCVIGTPNAAFEHLASPQSKAGHINLYSHERLRDLMRRHFHVVQSFGMNDVALHLGHPEARHYLLMTGIGPR